MSLSRPAKISAKTLACLAFVFAAIVTLAFTHRALPTLAIASRSASAQADTRLSGDYDYYVMLGAAPNGGFEARRRMGFAHFDGPSANGAWFKRRSGAPLYTITKVTVTEDNITVSLENGTLHVTGLLLPESVPLIPSSDTIFTSEEGVSYRFVMDASGKVTHAEEIHRGGEYVLKRLK